MGSARIFALLMAIYLPLVEAADVPVIRPQDKIAGCVEILKTEWWPVDGIRSYDRTFNRLLQTIGIENYHGYFQNWIFSRLANGKTAHVLDLFGSGLFVEHATTVTGMRRKPRRGMDLEKTPPQIYGDLFLPVTWETLEESMKERHIPAFDLITMSPVGGWPHVDMTPESIAHLQFIIKKALQFLSSDGELYFYVGEPRQKRELDRNFSRFLKHSGTIKILRQLTRKKFEMVCSAQGQCVIRRIVTFRGF